MKILIEESVLRQALEHIEYTANIGTSMSRDTCHYLMDESRKEADALRTALDAAEKVEPFCWLKQTSSSDNQPHGWAVHFSSGDVPLYTHPAPTIPEGWKLVPNEATEEMWDVWDMSELCGFDERYKLMIDAAPEPPAESDELREAARAVVEWSRESLEKRIDRLRKALG